VSNPSQYPESEVTSPGEIYFDKPNDEIEQSAIVGGIHFHSLGKEYDGICVSPQCEIGKADRAHYFTFCLLQSLEFFVVAQLHRHGFDPEVIAGKRDKKPPAKSQLKGFYNSLINDYLGNKTHRYYFLPGNDVNITDSVIDFEITECLSREQADALLKKGVLKSPWREDIPTRFASYIARIGTAHISKDRRQQALDALDIPILKSLL